MDTVFKWGNSDRLTILLNSTLNLLRNMDFVELDKKRHKDWLSLLAGLVLVLLFPFFSSSPALLPSSRLLSFNFIDCDTSESFSCQQQHLGTQMWPKALNQQIIDQFHTHHHCVWLQLATTHWPEKKRWTQVQQSISLALLLYTLCLVSNHRQIFSLDYTNDGDWTLLANLCSPAPDANGLSAVLGRNVLHCPGGRKNLFIHVRYLIVPWKSILTMLATLLARPCTGWRKWIHPIDWSPP